MLNFFDQADNAFISADRRRHKDGTFYIQLERICEPRRPELYGRSGVWGEAVIRVRKRSLSRFFPPIPVCAAIRKFYRQHWE